MHMGVCELRATSAKSDLNAVKVNHMTPNGHFSCRTAPLTSRRCIYIFIQEIYVNQSINVFISVDLIYKIWKTSEYFKHAAHSPVFPLQNSVYFIMQPFLVPVLFTF
jgi:hypothetical protein